MAPDRALAPGEALALWLPAGSEVFCAGGRLHIRPGPSPAGLDLPAVTLHPGQGWRAAEAVRVTLEALEPARCRLLLAEAPEEKPRQAGLWRERLAAAIRRGRRAA